MKKKKNKYRPVSKCLEFIVFFLVPICKSALWSLCPVRFALALYRFFPSKNKDQLNFKCLEFESIIKSYSKHFLEFHFLLGDHQLLLTGDSFLELTVRFHSLFSHILSKRHLSRYVNAIKLYRTRAEFTSAVSSVNILPRSIFFKSSSFGRFDFLERRDGCV